MRKFMFLAFALVLTVVVLVAMQPSPAAAAGPAYHIVRPGDTLSAIAWRYGLSTWAIANANHLWNPNYIYVGQVLVIPYVPNPYPVPQPYPNPVCYVRVNYGDTLSGIAWRLRVDVWSLARVNGIYNLNWIYAGQWLRVPNCTPGPYPYPTPVPNVRRNITGNWVSGAMLFQLAEAAGCPGPNCSVAGTYTAGSGSAAVQANGIVNVTTGAVSLTIPGASPQYFNGTINANSTQMAGQLTNAGAVTFTKQ